MPDNYKSKINPKRFRNTLAKAGELTLMEAGDLIIQKAVKRVPVDTGNLKKSIDKTAVKKSGLNLEITVGSFGVPYAAAQEFGTAMRGEPMGSKPLKGWPEVPPGKKTWGMYTIKPRKGEWLVFKIGGRWIRTKEVNHPGVPAQPYMRPSIDAVVRDRDTWKRIVQKNVRLAFKAAGYEVEG